jgi:hypothetical protein
MATSRKNVPMFLERDSGNSLPEFGSSHSRMQVVEGDPSVPSPPSVELRMARNKSLSTLEFLDIAAELTPKT